MATPVKQSRKANRNKSASPVVSAKKNRPATPVLVASASSGSIDNDLVTMDTEGSRDSPATTDTEKMSTTTDTEKIPVFKDPKFMVCTYGRAFDKGKYLHSSMGSGNNKRTRNWKNLKQIVAAERALPWQPDDVTYGMIDAPPSFKPAMKYSDLSGLPARYTDPQTKLRYATAEEYARIRLMPSDLVTGCLALRKANVPV